LAVFTKEVRHISFTGLVDSELDPKEGGTKGNQPSLLLYSKIFHIFGIPKIGLPISVMLIKFGGKKRSY